MVNNDSLFSNAEKKANKFNLYCLVVITILSFFAIVLHFIGIFNLERETFVPAMLQLAIYSAIPVIIYLFIYYVKKNKNVLEEKYFKFIILLFAYVSVLDLCISLSYHSVLLFAVPPLMVAQYKNNKLLSIVTFIASILLVIIATYGSYIFGQYDANLLKPLTSEEASDIRNRLNVLTFNRAIAVFSHYILPRTLAISVVDVIALTISKRNSEMIDEQIKLSNKIQEEIIAKSNMQNGVIEHLADIIESRDIETGEHIKRTKKYVTILVEKMKEKDQYKDYLTPQMCEYIIHAAPLHDIGKIAVSDLILCKPGKLTDEEFDKMKIHTVKGGEIINKILNDLGDKEFLNVAYDVAISHHEKWNGKGYPYGIKEEEIPLSGRIMAIADVFDALVAKRVYKDPMPVDKAIDIIINDAGSHFDPNIVEVFKEVIDDFKKTATED